MSCLWIRVNTSQHTMCTMYRRGGAEHPLPFLGRCRHSSSTISYRYREKAHGRPAVGYARRSCTLMSSFLPSSHLEAHARELIMGKHLFEASNHMLDGGEARLASGDSTLHHPHPSFASYRPPPFHHVQKKKEKCADFLPYLFQLHRVMRAARHGDRDCRCRLEPVQAEVNPW